MSVAVLTQFGYLALALLIAGESAGLPIPGETALIAAAALAAQGHLSIAVVLGTAAIAAVVGDNMGYGLGRLGGARLLSARGPWRGHRVRLLARGDAFFTRHGALAVLFGRWTPVLRVTASVLAGTHRMDWRRFVVWNTVGGVTWVLTIGGLAYLLAGRLPGALPALGLVMTATWVSALVGRYVYRRWATSAATGARAQRWRARSRRRLGALSAPVGWRVPAYAVSLATVAMLVCVWLDIPEL
jgi:undecaprenyl-diphosphatase